MQIAGISSPTFEKGLKQVHSLNAIVNLHTSNPDALKFLSLAAIVLFSFTSCKELTILLHSSLQRFSLFLHGNKLPGLWEKGTSPTKFALSLHSNGVRQLQFVKSRISTMIFHENHTIHCQKVFSPDTLFPGIALKENMRSECLLIHNLQKSIRRSVYERLSSHDVMYSYVVVFHSCISLPCMSHAWLQLARFGFLLAARLYDGLRSVEILLILANIVIFQCIKF